MFHMALLCRFYFDFGPTYIGCGLICPHIVNCSVLLGAIISWGFLWPFISALVGDWYPSGMESNNLKGLYGYKVQWKNLVLLVLYSCRRFWYFCSLHLLVYSQSLVLIEMFSSQNSSLKKFSGPSCCLQVFIAIALILGDGLYNLIKIIYITAKEMCNKSTKQSKLHILNEVIGEDTLAKPLLAYILLLLCVCGLLQWFP